MNEKLTWWFLFMKARKICNKNGVTTIELLVVLSAGCLLFLFMYNLFSHSVRSSMRGQDGFDSYRAANRLFDAFREDIMISIDYSFAATDYIIDWPLDDDIIPPAPAGFANGIVISHPTATVTYSFDEINSLVRRTYQEVSQPIITSEFGVPRMQNFELLRLNVTNRLSGLPADTEQILVNIVVQSEDLRFPSARIEFSSLFFPERRDNVFVDWNYLNLN